MNVEIISCRDRERWMAAFDRLPDGEKDIHWLPEYVDAHRQHRDGFACFVDDGEDVSLTTFVADEDSIGNPYGYGGMVGVSPIVVDDVRTYRCHPLFGHQVGEVEKHVAVLDLDCDDLSARLSKGHKAAIKKAENTPGVDIFESNLLGLGLFSNIYASTMERRGAAAGWRLVFEDFRRMLTLMGRGRVHFFFGRVNTKSDCGCLVLHGFNVAYYHFAGSYMTYPQLGLNHLMVLRVAEWAQKQGYRWLHLGGGVTASPDDPLLIFKKGFGGRLVPVHRYNGEANGAQAY